MRNSILVTKLCTLNQDSMLNRDLLNRDLLNRDFTVLSMHSVKSGAKSLMVFPFCHCIESLSILDPYSVNNTWTI